MKTVFFGTPEMALPALETLAQISRVRGVVCQPDRPAGRGMRAHPPATKLWAVERDLPVFQPVKVRDGELQRWLAALEVDVAVVLAYGRILPPDVLRTPRCGCVNLHASLLPRHRGAAPIQWCILSGDETTGISLMQMDEGLDTGPVYSRHSIAILPNEDAGSLTARLALLAADVLRADLAAALDGTLLPTVQGNQGISLAPPIRHEDEILDFSRSAIDLSRRIRALAPRPGAITQARQRRIKVLSASIAAEPTVGPPGHVTIDHRRILVSTGNGTLELMRLQIEGRTQQSAADIVNGRGLLQGDLLGSA